MHPPLARLSIEKLVCARDHYLRARGRLRSRGPWVLAEESGLSALHLVRANTWLTSDFLLAVMQNYLDAQEFLVARFDIRRRGSHLLR
jgi:hypothetical protein